MAKVFGAILAGGEGVRLGGRNKALVEVAGKTMLARARAAFPPVAAMALAGGRRFSGAEVEGMTLLPDPVAGAGPLAGLAAGLAWAAAGGADWLLTAPVDTPFLRRSAFERLLQAASDDIDAAIADAGGRPQWLAGLWRTSLAGAARDALGGDDLSIARFARNHRVQYVAIPGAGAMFLNVNTPDDLARADDAATREGK